MSEWAIEIEDLQFSWHLNDPILTVADFKVAKGEALFIRGPSGSGKSTLLNLLGGLVQPTQGRVALLGQELAQLSASQIDHFRAANTGVIFQQFNLLPYLSVLDNVILPCRFSAQRKAAAIERYGSLEQGASDLLARLGLADVTLQQRSALALSTGQQQRVAVARALLGAPKIVFADEPTSALDTELRDQFIDLLLGLCQDLNSTLLFVSHDASLQPRFSRVATMQPAQQGGYQL